MQWYYAVDNKPVGPVSEEEFQNQVRAGTVTPDTLVWHEGMANWEPHRAVAPSPRPSGVLLRPRVELHLASPPANCSQCSQPFPARDLVERDGALLCPDCTAAQEPGDLMCYAGFWIRLVAKLLDSLIFGAIAVAVSFGLGILMARGALRGNPLLAVGGVFAMQGLLVVLFAAVSVFFVGKFGGTPGKLALRLRIVRPDGSSVSYGLALGRFFAEILSGMILDIGYIMAAFDDEKRALHDRLCHTRVIRKQ